VRTEIIAVGSELLTPFFQDTNSLYLTERLNDLGLSVSFKTLVGDNDRDLLRVVRTSLGRSRLIFAIGGLGPTEDDRTREAFARALRKKLVLDPKVLAGIRERFRRRGLRMSAANRRQAYVIEGTEVMANPHGTAPGLWIQTSRHRIALLPGPPHELRPMFESHVLPRLASQGRGVVVRRVLRLTGIGESLMESHIKGLYSGLPAAISLTTLAVPGDLAVHLVYQGPASAAGLLGVWEKRISARLEPWIYSTNGESLEAVVGSLLKARGRTLACAESCTGGLLAHRLTNVPGSSAYFLESAVVYGNRAKMRRLRIPAALLARHGAVSAPVVRAMAEGVRKTSGADYALAITGIAGPGGGSPRKPVGLVYTALAADRRTIVDRRVFWGGREQVKFQSSQKALDLLRKELIKDHEKQYNGARGRR
jgi:nicotinamide-nucleotide amidase